MLVRVKPMKTLVIYVSTHHGNTKKIAEVIAEVLQAPLKRVDEVNVGEVEDYELIGFGSGIYAGRHHKGLFGFVEKLPSCFGKKAFIFSTKGGTPTFLNHWLLRKRLLSRGFEVVGEFSCKGFDTFGPFRFIGGLNKGRPDERDLSNARVFAEGLKVKAGFFG